MEKEAFELAGTLVKSLAAIIGIWAFGWGLGKGAGAAISAGLKKAGEIFAAPITKAIETALTQDECHKEHEHRLTDLESDVKNIELRHGEIISSVDDLKEVLTGRIDGLYEVIYHGYGIDSRPATTKEQRDERRESES